MSLYKNYVGIDIGKFEFVISVYGKKVTKSYENTVEGIDKFIKEHKFLQADSLCVLEATGGYEMLLLLHLCDLKIPVHRANTRKVKHFICSYGNAAKTDNLDAKALALYGYERHPGLDLFTQMSEKALALYSLVQRRNDLKQMLVAEKNRLQAPNSKSLKASFEAVIELLNSQLDDINSKIDSIIKNDEILAQKEKALLSIPGIGKKVASEILAILPELGHINRRQAASLAGLAPRARDSGQFKGYRSVAPGRNQIKPMLFLAAMAARNSNSELKEFYESLIARGKKKMVALTALMRKIVVIANARLKEICI